MRALFTHGLRGEAQKETEIGPVPESWEVSTLGEIRTNSNGDDFCTVRGMSPAFTGVRHHLFKPEMSFGPMAASANLSKHLTKMAFAISRVFPAGTILITIAANIGFTGILQFDSACPDSLVAVTPNQSLKVEFLEYFLQTQQEGNG